MRLIKIALAGALLLCVEAGASLVVLDDGTPPATAADPNLPIDGTLFINDAATGGGDTLIFTSTTTNFIDKALNLNGAAGAPGVPGILTLQGFAFASRAIGTSSNPANNWTARPASFTLTFTYLGANGVHDGMTPVDDVFVGSTEAIGFDDGAIGNSLGYEGAGRYLVNYDMDPSMLIDGLNEVFRIAITPSSGSIRFKTTGTSSALTDAKFSFSGMFAAIPEPHAMLFYGAIGCLGATLRRQPSAA